MARKQIPNGLQPNVAATQGKCREAPDEDRQGIMRGIEEKHFGRCLWQAKSDDGRTLIECMDYEKARSVVMLVKRYETPLPDGRNNRKWPKLAGAWVYVPVDPDSNTWEGLDAALTEFEDARRRAQTNADTQAAARGEKA